MGELLDLTSTLLLLGGAIALIVCGFHVAKPNLHGHKFEEGNW